jgi:protein O-GlcNAc transferase
MHSKDINPAAAWQAAMDAQQWSRALAHARAWRQREAQSLPAVQAELVALLLLHRTDEFSAVLLEARFVHGTHPLLAVAEACLLALLGHDAASHAALRGLDHTTVLLFATALLGPAMHLLNPQDWHSVNVRAFLLYEQQQACVWAGRDGLGTALAQMAEQPTVRWEQARFAAMTFGDDAVQLRLANRLADAWPAAAQPRAAKPVGKLRLAYLAPRLTQHATMVLLGKLPSYQNRALFDIYAYSYGAPPDAGLDEQALEGCGVLRTLPMDAQAAARVLAHDDIDVVVVLPDIEMNALAHIVRASGVPVVISYLSFISSSGGLAHYRVTDESSVYEAREREAAIVWPGSFYVYSDTRSTPTSRAAHGLPDDAIVIAAFNAAYKLSPALCEVWARLLRLSDAVLWLHQTHAEQSVQLHGWFAARGIAPERVIFAQNAPHAAHLGRLGLADLVLDAWDRGGHTTVLDALCAGVPVVGRAGPRAAQRVAPLLLRELGAGEFVAHSDEAYEHIAQRLCENPAERQRYRQLIAERRADFAPFDLHRQAERLDATLVAAYARYRSGLVPCAFEID